MIPQAGLPDLSLIRRTTQWKRNLKNPNKRRAASSLNQTSTLTEPPSAMITMINSWLPTTHYSSFHSHPQRTTSPQSPLKYNLQPHGFSADMNASSPKTPRISSRPSTTWHPRTRSRQMRRCWRRLSNSSGPSRVNSRTPRSSLTWSYMIWETPRLQSRWAWSRQLPTWVC